MIVAFTLCLVVVPLATLIIFSFRAGTPCQPGEFTLEHYTRAYSQVDTYTIFGNTFLLAIARFE